MRKNLLKSFALIFIVAAISVSCSSMAGRYVGYRLSPDKVATTGDISVSVGFALTSPVTVLLDDYAVPHISAATEPDLFFALGYMQGRDRRFQLELLKMLGYGRMRELVGNRDNTGAMKQIELMSRMLGFYEDAQNLLQNASAEDTAALEAFSAGVNAATDLEPMPMEFRVLNYKPEPWIPRDSLVIIAMTAFGLTKNWELELFRLELMLHQLRTGSTLDRAETIFKPRYNLPPYLIGGEEAGSPAADPFRDISAVPRELPAYLEDFARLNPLPETPPSVSTKTAADPAGAVAARDALAESLTDFFRGMSASNNWAADGTWTGTGKAVFAADSHMPHLLPSLGYLFHMELKPHTGDGTEPGTGYNVIGSTFAGLPAIPFGTNGSVAWGATSNWADVTDLFVEKPGEGEPGTYEYRGENLPFQYRKEVFKIRRDDGGFDAETYTVRQTKHGIIINDFIERIEKDFPLLAISRNRYQGTPLTALRDVYRSENVLQARDAMYGFYAFVGHWVMADDEGNIGYMGSVMLPKREQHLGTIPAPGWTGGYDWMDFIPAAELPGTVNPRGGIIATANNEVINPAAFPYPINLEGLVPFRYQRITQVLEQGRGSETPASVMAGLQMDDRFMGWELLKPMFHQELSILLKDPDASVAKAAGILLSWDGRNTGELTGPSIFNTFHTLAFKRALEDEVSPETLTAYLSYYNLEPFVYDVLSDPANPAWDDRRTEQIEQYGGVLRQVFAETVRDLEKRYGKNIDRWTWKNAAPYYVEHPFGTEKILAGYLNRGPLPLHGATDTVYAHQLQRAELDHFPVKGGPVLRVVVDFADMASSFMCVPGGESGRPSSPHYADMIPLFINGKGVPLELDFGRINHNAKGKIVLRGDE